MPEVVHRSPRVRPPAPGCTTFDLQAPPPLEPPAKLQPVQLLVPVLGSMSILVYGVMARTAVLLVTGGLMALASLASPLVLHWTGRRAQRGKLARRRERYRGHLAQVAAAAGSARAAVAAVTADAHPTPADHEAWIDGGRLWERRPEDPDLLEVALGTADVPSRIVLARQSASSVDADPDDQLVGEADALASEVAVLPGALLTFPLGDAGVVAVTGARGAALALVRAVLLELALTCAPDDLCLVVAVPPAEVPTLELGQVASAHGGGDSRRPCPSRRPHGRHLRRGARTAPRGRRRSSPPPARGAHLGHLGAGVRPGRRRGRPVRPVHRTRAAPERSRRRSLGPARSGSR